MEKEQQEVEAGSRVGSGGMKTILHVERRNSVHILKERQYSFCRDHFLPFLLLCPISPLLLLVICQEINFIMLSQIIYTCWQIYHFAVDFHMCSSLWAVTGWSSSLCFPLTHDHHSAYRKSTNGTTKQPGGVPLGWTAVTLVFYEMQTKPTIVYCLLLVSMVLNSELQR